MSQARRNKQQGAAIAPSMAGVAIVVLAWAAACGGGGGGAATPIIPSPPDNTIPIGISAVGPSAFAVIAGKSTPVQVRVFSAAGTGVANASIGFNANAGTLSPLVGVTDANGMTSTVWTPEKTPGQKTMTASVGGYGFIASFTATVTLAVPSALSAMGGPLFFTTRDRTGAVSVRATTSSGEPAFGATVQFSAQSGVLSATSATTGDDGVASVFWTTPTVVGLTSVTATSPGLSPVIYSYYVESGVPASFQSSFAFSDPLGVNTPVPVLPVITVIDAQGQPVAGAPVQFTSSNSVVVGTATLTDGIGQASPQKWTTGASGGVQTLTATIANLGSKTFSVTAISGGTITIAAVPELPVGAILSGTAAGPSGFTTQGFSILQPGSKVLTIGGFSNTSQSLPFGTYTIVWDDAFGGNPTVRYHPNPTQTTIVLSPLSPQSTAKVAWSK